MKKFALIVATAALSIGAAGCQNWTGGKNCCKKNCKSNSCCSKKCCKSSRNCRCCAKRR